MLPIQLLKDNYDIVFCNYENKQYFRWHSSRSPPGSAADKVQQAAPLFVSGKVWPKLYEIELGKLQPQ